MIKCLDIGYPDVVHQNMKLFHGFPVVSRNIMEYPFLAEEEQYYAIAKVIVSQQPEMICDSGVW